MYRQSEKEHHTAMLHRNLLSLNRNLLSRSPGKMPMYGQSEREHHTAMMLQAQQLAHHHQMQAQVLLIT